MIVNLRTEMTKIVERDVQYYKTDLKYDLEFLLNKEEQITECIWSTRDCGTNLYFLPDILIEGSEDNYAAHFYSNSPNTKFYKITITNKKRKNFYGTIETIDINKLFEQEIKRKKIESVSVEIKTKDDTRYNTVIPMSDHIVKDALIKLNLSLDDIQSKKIKYNLLS